MSKLDLTLLTPGDKIVCSEPDFEGVFDMIYIGKAPHDTDDSELEYCFKDLSVPDGEYKVLFQDDMDTDCLCPDSFNHYSHFSKISGELKLIQVIKSENWPI